VNTAAAAPATPAAAQPARPVTAPSATQAATPAATSANPSAPAASQPVRPAAAPQNPQSNSAPRPGAPVAPAARPNENQTAKGQTAARPVIEDPADPEADEPKKKKKIWLFIILGLVALALIAGLLFFFFRKYTITFDTAGGTPIAEEKVTRGKPVSIPADPEREGYDFAGWYRDEVEYIFNQPVRESFTLTAHWNVSKYVTFIVNGEQIAREHVVNGRVNFPTAPVVEGYNFVGWLDDGGNEVPDDKVFTEDTTLTAKYRTYIPLTSIKFEKGSYTMERGETLKPKLVIQPSNWVEVLTFTSSDSSVAVVSPEGVITANGAGVAVITVHSESGKSASTEITVKVSCKTLKFADIEVSIKKGEKKTLDLEIDPADTTDEIVYTTSNKRVATVDKNTGEITGVNYGTAVITATCGKLKTTVTVKVENPATGLDVGTGSVTLNAGETKTLTVKVTPSDSTSVVSYAISDTKVATVDSDGKITGVSGGRCVITVSTDNGLTKQVNVQVNQVTLLVELDQSGTITPGYLFYKADNRPVIKVSSAKVKVYLNGNESVVDVTDLTKLSAAGTGDYLAWTASRNELCATASATVSGGLKRTTHYSVTFKYVYEGKTVESKPIDITVEPVLAIYSVDGGSFSGSNVTVDGTGEVEFTIAVNQAIEDPAGSNVVVVSKNQPTPVANQPAYTNIKCRFVKENGATGTVTVTTKGGQKLIINVN
ncbi:MAG: InlB B-repeat-containing protein, partial [Erysipelotrichaceae bacterium]|nr:InlB B-repeat-containing protein [Erysipelotrichaceae bacterium]